MVLRTRQDYPDSIGQLDTTLYAFGRRVSDLYAHPCVRPAMDAIFSRLNRAGQYRQGFTQDRGMGFIDPAVF